MIHHEDSINNVDDFNDYIKGYNSDPLNIDIDKESNAFKSGCIQAEIDNDCEW